MSNVEKPFYIDFKNDLDAIGPGMCLAKWTQVTIHLHMGRTHSCHHPDTHPIPLNEVNENPTALHNTKYKKTLRKEMLEGLRPSECDYCWKIEDNSPQISDRIFKSDEPWSKPYLEEIKSLGWDANYNPKYVEVSFSNVCNFKCSYCSPSFSSQWVQEIEKYGPYPTTDRFNNLEWLRDTNRMPYKHNEFNPYVEAFWKWWPDLYNHLHTFRITGGEPLLGKDTWDVLDYIINSKDPNRELNFSINTNLGASDSVIDKFIEKINKIEDEKRVKSFVVYTSVDGWGEQAEYGRHGLNFSHFWDNINKILSKCPTVTIGIMTTYNALSVPSYHTLIKNVYELKKEYGSMDRAWTTPISLDASFLRHPAHQTVQVLPMEFADTVKSHGILAESLQEVFQHGELNNYGVTYGYTQMEIPKLHRIYDWMISPQNEKELKINQANFYRYFKEHDKRRGANFIKTFPEFEEFYNFCKTIKI